MPGHRQKYRSITFCARRLALYQSAAVANSGLPRLCRAVNSMASGTVITLISLCAPSALRSAMFALAAERPRLVFAGNGRCFFSHPANAFRSFLSAASHRM